MTGPRASLHYRGRARWHQVGPGSWSPDFDPPLTVPGWTEATIDLPPPPPFTQPGEVFAVEVDFRELPGARERRRARLVWLAFLAFNASVTAWDLVLLGWALWNHQPGAAVAAAAAGLIQPVPIGLAIRELRRLSGRSGKLWVRHEAGES